ncbi:UDP-4-amino-4,6-dideoxy-N-acetyl-beta-L-altrosamine N-acetyltransferase [Salinisphaera sp.]|uniref:UDP-4-amino-4, 6-dideoxy-N-acetyl-beta-L-altrosamine N-acetyltransferase n=1 Tax=Salinisphaera sp. TaxID=1914330 RepID=UPI000C39F94F|nr:UDP-4-amino-4,6-dideoxy-N-acetyl-beta-L-altrosamine N-acetyltransferase [Salinisphaera sp.]MBS62899.1 UDP-4-amino-4,6-dideoxy-N-acetyl-beta-L-altrosamine N-acetyltransferase [Salinisphaera sp.]
MTVGSPGHLRPLERCELELVRGWRNHDDVRKHMYQQHVIGRDEHVQWFERACTDKNKHLLVFDIGMVPTGFVNLTVRDSRARRADWGFYLAPDAPRGTGALLGRAALRHVFDVLELHKLCGEAIAYNDRSIRFHERMGFQRESILREQYFDGGTYHDVIGFGLLKSEWEEERRKNEHA